MALSKHALVGGFATILLNFLQEDDNSSSGSDTETDHDEEIAASALVTCKRTHQSHIKRVKVSRYYEVTIPLYHDDAFQQHFRLKRSTVKELYMIMSQKKSSYTTGRPGIPIEKCILASIWILANQESFRGVADRFGFSKGHLYRLFENFCNDICDQSEKFIVFPTGDEVRKSVQAFNVLRGSQSFPGVVGCVDGSHIPISKISTDSTSYYNRKGFHSVILRGICNSKFQFIDVFCGWPGASSDARVWRMSPICKLIPTYNWNPDFHLLGDSAYGVQQNLMAPYKDYGNLTSQQKRFNIRLSSSRVVIEQAFGLLKNRFRRLNGLKMTKLILIPKVILAACILHNICLLNSDHLDIPEIMHTDITINTDFTDESGEIGILKRDLICARISSGN